MAIDFGKERWAKIKEDYDLWWRGELKRPLMRLRPPRDPGRPKPRLETEEAARMAVWDLSVPVADIIDYHDYEMSLFGHVADAFPHFVPNFGPGIIEAFMGANVQPAEDTTWFFPKERLPIQKIKFEYDARNMWLERVRTIYRAAAERWDGLVQTAMTDLGGNLDTVAAFVESEKLLYDLYDAPEEVRRLTWEAHGMWWRYYEELDAIVRGVNPGYTSWLAILSPTPMYVLQCDFCYMISPAMFEEFVRPELSASAKRLGNCIYHLDGVGALPHLDALLSMPEIKAIQWVYGDGQPGVLHWPHVYRKIRDAGKLLYISCSFAEFDTVVERLGSAEGIYLNRWETTASPGEIKDFMAKYGVK